jgi:hypothetical protein
LGYAYVVDFGHWRVVKLSAAGLPITWWGSQGTGDYQFNAMQGIAVSPGGAVYVADPGLSGDTNNHRVLRFGRDATAPATTATVSPSGWTAAASATVSLAAEDPAVADQYRSGMAPTSPTQISRDGGATWQDYTAPIVVSDEGQTDVLFKSRDAVGNVETAKTATVRIDRTAPSTTVTRVPSVTWSKTPVTLTFVGSDALSGWASTQYSTNGGATWTTGSSVRITAQGTTTLLYRSTDVVDNVEATKTASVHIDGIKPAPKAPANATVKRGKTVKLRYRVKDSACPQVTVTIKIFKGAKKIKTLYLRVQLTGHDLSYAYKCKLAKGKYTWKVYASDLAGNAQTRVASRTLTVTAR